MIVNGPCQLSLGPSVGAGLSRLGAVDAFSPDAQVVVLEADTLEATKALPDGLFSLIVTSPPYNIGKAYEEEVELQSYLSWQMAIIAELVRLLSPRGSLCWQVGNYVRKGEVFPLDMFFYPIFKSHGMQLRNRIIWHFNHGLHASRRFSGRYETLLWFTKADTYTFNLDSVRVPAKYPGKTHFKGEKQGQPSGNPLGKNPSDFWDLMLQEWETGVIDIPNVKSNHPEKTIHPCQFPIELIERLVLALTNEDEWVLDPFSGVGSTLLAAARQNRRSVGIDRDPLYCEITRQRIDDLAAGRLKYRPLGKPIHQPSGREKVSQVPAAWLCNEDGR